MRVGQLFRDLWEVRCLPRVTINLEAARARVNDPFYMQLVEEFYRGTRRRHRRFPLIRSQTVGVAVCPLPCKFDDYFMQIEAAARRNVKKARRLGYEFHRIAYNDYLADVRTIRRSSVERQGALPEEFLNGDITPSNDPPSRDEAHD
jgi:hypothetical protein